MHDRTRETEQDSMWLYLRSFDIFKQLEPRTQRAMVPGTALSYEDSRGFIPLDKYRFRFDDSVLSQPGSPSPGGVGILGCPRTAIIRENLGYRSLRLRVDSEKEIVLAIEYADLGGRTLKTYTTLREIRIGDRVFPGEVRVEHEADGFVTQIGYEYWLPRKPPPRSLFEPSTESVRFIDRLKAYVAQIGQGQRIREELERADERVREFEEKLRRIHEAERRGMPFRE